MISFLRGKVHSYTTEHAEIDVNGVGYLVYITKGAFSKLKASVEICLDTELIVREDSMTVYGFQDGDEREIFRLLYNVSGIGPKTAVAILSTLSVDSLILAISIGDIKTLSSVPGIGKKTAERLALELRDKVRKYTGAKEADYIEVEHNEHVSLTYDAVLALVSLGYTQYESEQIVRKVKGDLTEPAAIVRAALSEISKNR